MIPPQVTYGLTERAQDLLIILDQLSAIAQSWYEQEHKEINPCLESNECVREEITEPSLHASGF